MYPIHCIAPTGRTNYITPPIFLDDADLLWHQKHRDQVPQYFQVHLSSISIQYRPPGDGTLLPRHTSDGGYNASVLRKLRDSVS